MNVSAVRRTHYSSTRSAGRRGFTLIELLVVISIIAVLIGILIPVIGKVRIKAREVDTRNFIIQLSGAIERYQTVFGAYPGPIPNNDILYPVAKGAYVPVGYTSFAIAVPTGVATGATGFDITSQNNSTMPETWTMSENLVLGLLGGLHKDSVTPAQLDYDPSAVGSGPTSLNTVGIPKRYPAFIDGVQLSWQTTATGKSGHYFDAAGSANDSMIPEFVDRFTDPMPILYMRAKVGASPQTSSVAAGTFSAPYNPIITNDLTETTVVDTNNNALIRQGQYDLSQIIGYTGSSIGVGRAAKLSKYSSPPANGVEFHGIQGVTYNQTLAQQYPYDAYPYFTGSAGVARQKDAYILISAGADRVYGTEDDIANFGTVGE